MHCIEQDSLSRRRSVYGLGKLSPASNACLLDSLRSCLLNCPSPFNAQSARLAVLFGDSHRLFWSRVWENLKNLVPNSNQKSVKEKIAAFANAHGTIMYFEDKNALRELEKQFPTYRKNMRLWTQQANGMLQFLIWQILTENNIGASLQHYNEIIEKDIYSLFDIPKSWEIVAQMPFGSIEKEPPEKTFLPLEPRIKIFK